MGFQLMQILGLLGMYFDAVVVEVKIFLSARKRQLALLVIEKFFFVFFLVAR